MTVSRIRNAARRFSAVGLRSMLCTLLGILWAVGPTLHGVVHLAEVDHRHTAGSAHTHGHDHGHSESHDHDSHSDATGAGHDHETDSRDGDSRDRSQEPSDSDSDRSQIFFTTLELAAPSSIALDLEFSFVERCLGEFNVEQIGAFFSQSIGASGPRGPPIWT